MLSGAPGIYRKLEKMEYQEKCYAKHDVIFRKKLQQTILGYAKGETYQKSHNLSKNVPYFL